MSYDVSQDDRRARLAALCSAFGDRIQQSVFECTLSDLEVEDLVRRSVVIVDLASDSVHVVPICGGCHDRRSMIGQAEPPSEDPYWIV